jgi:hypothetical protein
LCTTPCACARVFACTCGPRRAREAADKSLGGGGGGGAGILSVLVRAMVEAKYGPPELTPDQNPEVCLKVSQQVAADLVRYSEVTDPIAIDPE